MANIKQSVINTFNRINIPYEKIINLLGDSKTEQVANRFSGELVTVTPLIAECINWVYGKGEDGVRRGTVKVSDFDRIRYFVLAEDSKAYMACLD